MVEEVCTIDELKEILSHLRNAYTALEHDIPDITRAAIRCADNIICQKLFGETYYDKGSKPKK